MSVTTEELRRCAASERFRAALDIPKEAELEFTLLGQGEYNINYVFTHPVTGKRLVLRLNTGSQMHLADQIGYEYRALRLLEGSGRTPRAYYVDGSRELIDEGLLVMEFLPGRPLDYDADLELAAECLADIHKMPWQASDLICPNDPLEAMLDECRKMAGAYLHAPQGERRVKAALERFLDRAARRMRSDVLMPRCIINTELNSGNFLINGPGPGNYLIDWEKPILGEAAQDLGHFLAPTTTLWKTDVLLSAEQKERFLGRYLSRRPDLAPELLHRRTAEYETMTCLRGISWCAMAWVEYQSPDRPIKNEETCRKILTYLDAGFLDWLWDGYFA